MDRDPFDLVGDVLDGQFRVDAFAGEGDLSVVYKGHHLGVDATVAIKCLNLPDTLDPALARPLVDGFKEASRVHYRLARGNLHIAQTIASGSTLVPRSGVTVPYLVREWYEGESLKSELERRRAAKRTGQPLDQVLLLFETAFEAVGYAHAQGEVHLSLNPSNLFVVGRSGSATPMLKVLDFGVASTMNALGSGLRATARPSAGLRLLFPAYAAPEQLDRNVGDLGPWTDVYALALIMMEALSDRVVMGETETGAIVEHALDEHRRPTPQLHGLKLPSHVERALTRAVARAPERRQKNAAELWKDVRAAVRTLAPRAMSNVPPPEARTPEVVAPKLSASPPVSVQPPSFRPASVLPASPPPPSLVPNALPSLVPNALPSLVPNALPSLVPRADPSRLPPPLRTPAPARVRAPTLVGLDPLASMTTAVMPGATGSWSALAVATSVATRPMAFDPKGAPSIPVPNGTAIATPPPAAAILAPVAAAISAITAPAPAVAAPILALDPSPIAPLVTQDRVASVPQLATALPVIVRPQRRRLEWPRSPANAVLLSVAGALFWSAVLAAFVTVFAGSWRRPPPRAASEAAAASPAPTATNTDGLPSVARVASVKAGAAPAAGNMNSVATVPVAPSPSPRAPSSPSPQASPPAASSAPSNVLSPAASPAAPALTTPFRSGAAILALDGKWRAIAKCRRGNIWGKTTTTVTFSSDGSVDHVDVAPPFTGTPTGDCIVDELSATRIQPFAEKTAALLYRVYVAPR